MPPEYPLVSVVIPAYEAAERIELPLSSVFAQTYPASSLEIIVVDDGSQDGTASRALEFLSKTTISTEVISIKNGGPSRARNVGWRASTGEWIQFLDDDDRLESTKIETQIRQIDFSDPEVAVVYSPWQRVHPAPNSSQKEGRIEEPVISPDSPLRDLLTSENFIATGSQLFHRHWLEKVDGFDERFSVIEDVHLMLRIAMEGGRFVHASSDKPQFFYRQRDEGSLSSNQTAFIEGCLRNARMVERYARDQKQMTERLREQLIRVYFYGARFYAPRCWGRFNEIWSCIQRLDPDALPESPAHLRTASRLLGYPTAERVAIAYRRLKHALGFSRQE